MILLLLFLFVLTCFWAYYFREKNFILSYYFLGIILVMIATFRGPEVDCDYEGYVEYYNRLDDGNLTIEPSFCAIGFLVKNVLFDNVVFVFFIYSILGVFLKIRGIVDLTDFKLESIVIYLSCYYILHDMTQIRAGVASGLLLLCIKPLYERKLGPFLILSLVACLFHYSAMIIFFLWFIKPTNLNCNFYSLLIPVGYVFHFAGFSLTNLLLLVPIDAIQQKVNAYFYLSEYADSLPVNVFNILFLLRCTVAYLILWKVELICVFNKYVYLLLKIYMWGLMSFLVFSDIAGFSTRISELLGIVEIIMIPFIIYVFSPKRISFFVPMLIGLLFLSINLFYVNLIN